MEYDRAVSHGKRSGRLLYQLFIKYMQVGMYAAV
jgi:hypothetical protein